MPKKCTFIAEYLIPSLNSQRFGRHLQWLDQEKSIFQLNWYHKSVSDWSEGEARVFVEWDKLKGHYKPGEKQYFTSSKQRFRALLYKLSRDGQLREIQSDKKSKKIYCITGVKNARRRKRQLSSADSGIFSTDDYISSDDNEMLSEDLNTNEVNEFCNVNSINNLDDHNYSKHLINESDLQDMRSEHHQDVISTFTCENIDPGKKVIVQQSYPHHQNDLSKTVFKEKTFQTDFSQVMFEDLQTGSENAMLRRNNGFAHGLEHCSSWNENVENTATLNSVNIDMNEQFEKFLSDLNVDDMSNLNNLWKSILLWP